VLLNVFSESSHVNSHIELRGLLQSNDTVGYQISRCPVVADESFEIGGGELDKGLEEVSLLGAVSYCMPEPFEDFVTFPPVGEVVEVDPVQIVV